MNAVLALVLILTTRPGMKAFMTTGIAGLAVLMTPLEPAANASAQNFGMSDVEKYFTIDWEQAQYRGRPSVRGYIANHWGLAATDVRLKVEGLNAAGAVTSTTVE